MSKLWDNSLHGKLDSMAEDFNSSIRVDSLMVKEDILGSIAHADMLFKCNIISEVEYNLIVSNLKEIDKDLDSGKLSIDYSCEDVHEFIENTLVSRIGDVGKKLHTARSRNDQVTCDLRMYLKNKSEEIIDIIKSLISTICDKAQENTDTVLPGYTHLQRAQPITYAFYLLSYAAMLERDMSRLKDAVKRMNVSPLGSCALAGTTYNTDRDYEAIKLQMSGVCVNAMDGVSDRDYVIEIASVLSIISMHLSRLSEEIIIWSSSEFGFIKIGDEFTTGSSIMPQKKNPDIAELIRGKTGRVYGNLVAILTVMKGLPLAYNKDLQEDKNIIFDSIDTVYVCLAVMNKMLLKIESDKDKMLDACKKGYIEATDVADYLTKKGIPFREAYKITGNIVSHLSSNNKSFEELSISEYKLYSDKFEDDIYEVIDINNIVNKRCSKGATSKTSVMEQILYFRNLISSE